MARHAGKGKAGHPRRWNCAWGLAGLALVAGCTLKVQLKDMRAREKLNETIVLVNELEERVERLEDAGGD